jgi:hypothetical protein
MACTRLQPSGVFPNSDPCDLGKPVGFAVATAQQEHQSLVRQILDRVLLCSARDLIRLAAVVDDSGGR